MNAKKFLIISALLLLNVIVSYAQTNVAILSHEGTLTSYYGADAFKNALNAAADGDIITLSAGSFLATNILKDITIRGAGMDTYGQSGAATVLLGDFYFSKNLYMEGLYHDGTMSYHNTPVSATFVKCRFRIIKNYGNSSAYALKALFVHCKVANEITLSSNSDVTCINSFISCPLVTSSASLVAQNCILLFKKDGYHGTTVNYLDLYNSTIKNSYIYNKSGDSYVPKLRESNIFKNNLYYGINSDNIDETNQIVGYSHFFKTWNGEYRDTETFETLDFSESAVKNYLGDDGKIIGIYGGRMPFDPHPTYPRLSKFEVDSATDSNGKLKVNIQVTNE